MRANKKPSIPQASLSQIQALSFAEILSVVLLDLLFDGSANGVSLSHCIAGTFGALLTISKPVMHIGERNVRT